jgi:hypothetical protein
MMAKWHLSGPEDQQPASVRLTSPRCAYGRAFANDAQPLEVYQADLGISSNRAMGVTWIHAGKAIDLQIMPRAAISTWLRMKLPPYMTSLSAAKQP